MEQMTTSFSSVGSLACPLISRSGLVLSRRGLSADSNINAETTSATGKARPRDAPQLYVIGEHGFAARERIAATLLVRRVSEREL